MRDYTDEELERLEKLANHPLFDDVVEYLKELWVWKEYIKIKDNKLIIYTGGFSCHETIIGILEKSVFWAFYWESSHEGGMYVFKRK